MRSWLRIAGLCGLAGLAGLGGLGGLGCSFSANPTGPGDGAIDDGPPHDGAIDTPTLPDARACFGAGLGMTCLSAAPTSPLVLPDAVFDTGGAGCTEVVTVGGIQHCVMAGTTVGVAAATTFRATGARPLIVIASTVLTISGTLSVSSSRGGLPGAGAAI
ncbi:MAG: hypothetical protein M3680_09015, partial [Myxococcota bacterium]|nr:hypothetical protein [Myxococcota bacterium]